MGCTQVTAKLETEYYPTIWDPHATKSTGKKEKKSYCVEGEIGFLGLTLSAHTLQS